MTADVARLVARDFLLARPGEAGRALDAFSPGDVADTLGLAEAKERVEVLHRMNSDAAASALAEMPAERAGETLAQADPIRIARWLVLLGEGPRKRLFDLLPKHLAAEVDEALEFPPGTAGWLMDPVVLSFRPDATSEEVFSRLRGRSTRRITDIMLTDEGERLVGVVALQDLVSAPQGTPIGDLAQRAVRSVNPMATQDEVVELLSRHHLASIPVVDLEGRLLGVIRHDALVRAAQQAATDNLQQMVGAAKEERALSPATFTVKSRLPWLLINLATAFAAASVVGIFDATIAKFTALAVLMPVVAGQSGNTGAQALAVISRGLALREIRTSHWWRVLRKEVFAAAANGVAVALVTSGAVLVWSSSAGLALVIGISMVASMVLAAAAGAAIPILLTAAGRDPATASSIILTTVTDIAGFFSFLGLATLMADLLVGT